MALPSQQQPRSFENPCLPYVTNTSPTSSSAQFIAGRNVLTSIKQQNERRGGFATTLEATPFTPASNEHIKRIFLWAKWDGTYYAMYSTTDASKSYVYKLAIGAATATKIHTCSTSTEPFDFVVFNNTCYFGNGTDMKAFDATSTSDTAVRNWGFAAPTLAPMLGTSATGINAASGYYYVKTYWNSATAHESSPGPISACIGTFTNKQIDVTVDNSDADAQVTHFRLYRTIDGGENVPEKMQEVTNSPFTIATTLVHDTTTDALLSTRTAPVQYYNDPPPASKGFVTYGGRIWMFVNASTWATGAEEISNGRPQECVVGSSLGINGGGNVWNWDREVTAHAPMDDGVAVFTAGRIWKIEGTTLDTFQYYRLLERRGCRNRAAVASVGSSIAWLDTASQVWLSDLGEIGLPIRPDIASINHSQAALTIHISGTKHWLMLMDGANGLLYVFDLDTKQWMVPWSVGTTVSAIASGETASGVVDLTLARNGTKVLKYAGGTYNDDGSVYSAYTISGLLPVTPKATMLSIGNPFHASSVMAIETKTDNSTPATVRQVNDDDPSQVDWSTVTALDRRDPDDVQQGTYLKLNRYPSAPTTGKARMASVRMEWPAEDRNFKLYGYWLGLVQTSQ